MDGTTPLNKGDTWGARPDAPRRKGAILVGSREVYSGMDTRQFAPIDAAAVPGKSGVSVAFILCPHFTLMPFAAIVDTLRLAADDGDGSRQIHCRWTIVGPSLDPVEASCGVKVQPWETF